MLLFEDFLGILDIRSSGLYTIMTILHPPPHFLKVEKNTKFDQEI